MKKIVPILVLWLTFVFGTNAIAQPRKGDKNRWDKFRTEKIAFLTASLDLTPEEAQVFWPVYNQMEKERWKLQGERNELDRKVFEASETMADDDVIKLTREYVKNKRNEGELDESYNEKFLKILSPQKVLKLYKAEGEFRMHMFRKFREKRQCGNENNNEKK